jgi:hypothetical protein
MAHSIPIPNKTPKPINSNFLTIAFLTRTATDMPPIQAAIIAIIYIYIYILLHSYSNY